jgi:hypothetical protein
MQPDRKRPEIQLYAHDGGGNDECDDETADDGSPDGIKWIHGLPLAVNVSMASRRLWYVFGSVLARRAGSGAADERNNPTHDSDMSTIAI